MLIERFFDFLDDTDQFEFTGWRCLICGEIVGPLITAKEIPNQDVETAAESLLAYMEGVLLLAKTQNDPEVIRRLRPGVTRCLAGGPGGRSRSAGRRR